jgi:cytochrome b
MNDRIEPLSEPSREPVHEPVRVWDLPTRMFHWLLALAVIGAVVTAKVGGNAMVWHFRLGLAVLALLAFRIVWGFVGGRWSRFASFAHGPGAVARYLKGHPRPGERFEVGHSPLGAWSVFALLLVLAVQVGTGLVADDEIASVGPLNRFVDTDTGLTLTWFHKEVGEKVVIVLVALHLGAIAFYRWVRRRDLIGPMLRGDQLLPAGTPASDDGTVRRLMALVLIVACIGLARWVASLGAG